MTRPLPTLAPLLALLLAAPTLAFAQPGPPSGGPGGGAPGGKPGTADGTPPPPPPRMFLSPSGQPFRPSHDGRSPFDAWFAQADANHDGQIDRAEFRADAMAFFKQLDTNGDGHIDGFEISAYEHKVVPELVSEVETRAFGPPEGSGDDAPQTGKGHGRGGGRRGGGPPEGGGHRDHGGGEDGRPDTSGRGHWALLNEPEPVSGADLDVDGKVTAEEWLKATDRRFDQLDDKHVGVLTRDALFAKLPKPPVKKK